MGSLTDHAARIRSVLSIEDLVGQYVALRRFGRNYKGLCPFHQEKTPSFTVSPDRGTFHCFGCQAGGDIISFVSKIENLEFIDTLAMLSERAGIAMPELEKRSPGKGSESRHKALLEASNWALAEYQHHLRDSLRQPESTIAGYLNSRALDPELCNRFGLGLAPDSWDWLATRSRSRGVDPDLLIAAGILGKGTDPPHRIYDRFRGRLLFPITDLQHRVVALAGRIYLPEARTNEAKYINSPESEIYKKGDTLYALPQARADLARSGKAMLMEGYLDVIRAHQHGFTNSVATCGTALTERQAKTLKRFAREVLFAYDGDAAGQEAMLRSTALLLAEGLEVRVVPLPAQDDPDSFLRTQGAKAFEELVEGAPPWLDHFLRSGLQLYGTSIAGKTRVADQVLPLISRIPHPITRETSIQRVSAALGVSLNSVEDGLRRYVPRASGTAPKKSKETAAQPSGTRSIGEPQVPSRAETGLVRLLIESVRARAAILPALENEQLHQYLICAPLIEHLLQLPRVSPPDYPALIESLRNHPLGAVLCSMAVDPEPLDESDRTIHLVLARMRREKSIARLRQLTATEQLLNDDEVGPAPEFEVNSNEWDSLSSSPPATIQNDLFQRLQGAQDAASEAAEHANTMFGRGSDRLPKS